MESANPAVGGVSPGNSTVRYRCLTEIKTPTALFFRNVRPCGKCGPLDPKRKSVFNWGDLCIYNEGACGHGRRWRVPYVL